MEFVQKAVFSNNTLSTEVMAVLGARGKRAVKAAFEGSKDKPTLYSLFSFIIENEFITTDTFDGYNNDNKMSFMSFHKAIGQLPNFTEASAAFTNEVMKRRKLYIMLEGLEAIEADMIIRIVQKRFDVENVTGFLFPDMVVEDKPKRKRFRKESEESIEVVQTVVENVECQVKSDS